MTEDVRIALILGIASAISVVALFPYLLTIAPKLRASRKPLWLLILMQAVRAGFSMTLLAWIGLRVGAPFGLDAPLLRGLVSHRLNARPREFLLAATAGAVAGIAILLLDRYLFQTPNSGAGSRWKGFLAAFYGAFVEEVLSRLFLMSMLVWLLARLHPPDNAVFLVACLLSAMVFAAGHLPTAAQVAPLNRSMVTRVLVLNTLAGVVFGILFWRYGLEQAMVAHFATDLVLHVVA